VDALGGKTWQSWRSRPVNNVGSVISRNILLLLLIELRWYWSAVGSDFHLPRRNISLSEAPAASAAVGPAIRRQCEVNQSGLKPNTVAQLFIARCIVVYCKQCSDPVLSRKDRNGSLAIRSLIFAHKNTNCRKAVTSSFSSVVVNQIGIPKPCFTAISF